MVVAEEFDKLDRNIHILKPGKIKFEVIRNYEIDLGHAWDFQDQSLRRKNY